MKNSGRRGDQCEASGKDQTFCYCWLFFFMWAIFKVFIKFVTTLLLVCFGFLAMKNAGSSYISDERLNSHPLHRKAESTTRLWGQSLIADLKRQKEVWSAKECEKPPEAGKGKETDTPWTYGRNSALLIAHENCVDTQYICGVLS